MWFKDFLIVSSGGHFVYWLKTIKHIWQGHYGKICEKLFENCACHLGL